MGNPDFSALRDSHRRDLPNKDEFDLGAKLRKQTWSSEPANQRPGILAVNEYGLLIILSCHKHTQKYKN